MLYNVPVSVCCCVTCMYAGVYGWLTAHGEAEKCNWSPKPNHTHSALLIKVEYGLQYRKYGWHDPSDKCKGDKTLLIKVTHKLWALYESWLVFKTGQCGSFDRDLIIFTCKHNTISVQVYIVTNTYKTTITHVARVISAAELQEEVRKRFKTGCRREQRVTYLHYKLTVCCWL